MTSCGKLLLLLFYACRFVPLLMAYPFGSYVGAFFCSQIALLSFCNFSSPFSQILLEEAQIFAFNLSAFLFAGCKIGARCELCLVWVYWSIVHRDHVKICSIFGIDMGCVRVRGGAVGGLRLSMERRRLLNAQITATRHR
jgi:hypothetical protein